MNQTFLGRLSQALASVRLAVVIMATLGSASAAATFYEAKHGTAAVQRVFYQSGWFTALLVLLGVNIFCAMVKRSPWNKHHIGFLLAHFGILLILAGSVLSIHAGLDGHLAVYEKETTDRVSLPGEALHVALPGHEVHATIPVTFEGDAPGPGRERRIPIPRSDVTLIVGGFYAHARVAQTLTEGESPNPALHFLLAGASKREERWLLASDPERQRVDFGPVAFSFQAPATGPDAMAALQARDGNHLAFVLRPDGTLAYTLSATKGRGSAGAVAMGRALPTPWMGLTVTVDRLLPRTALRRSVEPEPLPERPEGRLPAVEVRLQGPAGESEAEWVPWTESRKLRFGGGLAVVSYGAPEVALPFRITLLDFNAATYPGSNRAATYESRVRVEDPGRGVSEHLISMNHPLHYRGYIFFQSSFVEGEPMMSILTVARSPGLPLVYAGTALISAGVAWMFYLKPYLARRQARAALARVRARPTPGRLQVGEPARTRI